MTGVCVIEHRLLYVRGGCLGKRVLYQIAYHAMLSHRDMPSVQMQMLY